MLISKPCSTFPASQFMITTRFIWKLGKFAIIWVLQTKCVGGWGWGWGGGGGGGGGGDTFQNLNLSLLAYYKANGTVKILILVKIADILQTISSNELSLVIIRFFVCFLYFYSIFTEVYSKWSRSQWVGMAFLIFGAKLFPESTIT